MKKKYLLGFDVGTSESKGTLTDLTGHVLAMASVKHDVISVHPGFAEHDPLGEWMEDLKKVIRSLLMQVQGNAGEIAAVGISTIMAAVTFVDENCEPLRNAILYGIDTRCGEQAEKINSMIGRERMEQEFGTLCTVEHFGPKILWVKENEPEIFARTKHITFASGFLTARLTGNYFVDKYSVSSALPMLDVKTMQWGEFCGIICSKELLPQIAESTYSVVGTVTGRAAEETGLAEGTAVICGTTDAGAEAVSAGVVQPGDTMLMYGSTTFYINVAKEQIRHTKLWCGDYTIDHLRCYTGGMATTGSLTRWIRDELAADLVKQEESGGENAYTALFREAEGISAGSDGLIVLPYFQGERMPLQDTKARGVVFGLNLHHTRGHIVHAAFEGIGYGIAQNLQLFAAAGIPVDRVTAVGGGTKSLLWLQVVSDICGITQQVPEITVGASYGDTLMAGMAIGTVDGPEAIKRLVKIRHVIEPDMEKFRQYQRYKEMFAQLYERNKDIMHIL